MAEARVHTQVSCRTWICYRARRRMIAARYFGDNAFGKSVISIWFGGSVRNQMVWSLLSSGTMLLWNPAHADEPMRCGSSLVTSSIPLAELMEKCGEPENKETRVEDVYAPNVNRAGNHKVGIKTIEIWTYRSNSRSLPVVVTIIDGKIKSIVTMP